MKWYNISIYFQRKLAHILVGIIFFFLANYFSRDIIIFLLTILALFFLAVRPFKLFAPVYHYGKNSLGEVYFPLGLILAAFYFLPEQLLAFQFGVLVLSFSDALAAIFGNGLGKNEIRIWGEKKTLLGSFAFFISTCIIAFFLSFPGGNLEWWRVMTASLILTFVEMILAFGLDNLILPILAAQLFVALL